MDLTSTYATVADIERTSDPMSGGVAVRLLSRRDDEDGYKTIIVTDNGFKVARLYNRTLRELIDTLVIYESETVTAEHLMTAEAFDVFKDDEHTTFDRYTRAEGTVRPQGETREYQIPMRADFGDETAVNDDA